MFLFMLIAPLGSTFGAITSVNQALGALGRIQEILDLPTETQGDAALATRVRDADDRRAGSPGAAIEFRDVHFRYPEAVVAARRTAESEALAVLENAHVDAYSMSGTEDLAPDPASPARCCAECPSRCREALASHWSGRRARERARPSPSSSASTTRRTAPC